MPLTRIDIGAELGKGWRLFQPNMGLLIVAGVIATVVSIITCGLLGGPLMAGMLLVVRRLIQNDPVKPQPGDVFKGLDYFVQSLILVVLCMAVTFLLAMIPVIGQLAGVVVSAVLMWGLVFVTYQKLSAIDALKQIFEYLKTGEFTLPLVFGIIAGIISSLGAVACLVGLVFTLPLGYCMMACCYETLFGSAPEVIEPAKDAPPPSDLRL
ncbi:MAG TPA: hypothetical protein PKM57_10985 [Kiritimatiellia bacterium]|nr:hypothetical protein [Kiritimatiellia bacterium]HPS06362.1 hypothetical protein [Kiritimatiellia bacterium]